MLQFNLLSRRLSYEWDRYQRGLPIDGPSPEELAAIQAEGETEANIYSSSH